MIEVLAAEYHYPLEAMERDVPLSVEIDGRRRTRVTEHGSSTRMAVGE